MKSWELRVPTEVIKPAGSASNWQRKVVHAETSCPGINGYILVCVLFAKQYKTGYRVGVYLGAGEISSQSFGTSGLFSTLTLVLSRAKGIFPE